MKILEFHHNAKYIVDVILMFYNIYDKFFSQLQIFFLKFSYILT